jgi:hypothetical protein
LWQDFVVVRGEGRSEKKALVVVLHLARPLGIFETATRRGQQMR